MPATSHKQPTSTCFKNCHVLPTKIHSDYTKVTRGNFASLSLQHLMQHIHVSSHSHSLTTGVTAKIFSSNALPVIMNSCLFTSMLLTTLSNGKEKKKLIIELLMEFQLFIYIYIYNKGTTVHGKFPSLYIRKRFQGI